MKVQKQSSLSIYNIKPLYCQKEGYGKLRVAKDPHKLWPSELVSLPSPRKSLTTTDSIALPKETNGLNLLVWSWG